MIFLLICIVVFLIVLILKLQEKRYKEFVIKHSVRLLKIRELNKKYQFNNIERFVFSHCYDNENFYNDISTRDYLIYELVYKKRKVKSAIEEVLNNYNLYEFYQYDINDIKEEGVFDVDTENFVHKKLVSIEKNIVDRIIQKPVVEFTITVILTLTDINGHYKRQKVCEFNLITIEDILSKMADKSGERYNDKKIWDSICRVERGKVSNKMRFAIFKRDHNRCRYCGRTTNLEVDHIIPISKGGKTVYDNLQTLCHHCNLNKSNRVMPRTGIEKQSINGYCPKCGAPLKLRIGKYGEFYGCMNYPKCDYTKNK